MKIAFDVDVLAKQMSIRDMVYKVADWVFGDEDVTVDKICSILGIKELRKVQDGEGMRREWIINVESGSDIAVKELPDESDMPAQNP